MGSTVEVFIVRAFSGQIVRMPLPQDVPVSELLGEIAQRLELPYPVQQLGLYNLTRDFEYIRTETLRQRGVGAGDLLLIAPGSSGCPR